VARFSSRRATCCRDIAYGDLCLKQRARRHELGIKPCQALIERSSLPAWLP
jgi:hypothetical protein